MRLVREGKEHEHERNEIVWVVALLLGAAVLLSPAACTMRRHQQIAEAVKAGADPMEAKCAIEGENTHTPACIVIATRARKN